VYKYETVQFTKRVGEYDTKVFEDNLEHFFSFVVLLTGEPFQLNLMFVGMDKSLT